jgi:hypothetical protein
MSDPWTSAFWTSQKQTRRRSLMTPVAESRIQAWDRAISAETQLQQMFKILAGTLGIVLVTLLTWVVLLVVR